MSLMPPAIQPNGQSSGGMDPTTLAFMNMGSSVLGKALSPGTAGPSQASTGGYFDFGDSPFVVNMGAGSAAAAVAGSSPLVGMAIALVVALVGYKLWKNQYA